MFLFLLIFILSALLQIWLPWWIIAPLAAVLSFFMGKNFSHSFFACFFGAGLVWFFYAIYIDIAAGSLMTDRIASLLALPAASLLYIVGFFVAAIAGGIGGLVGYSLKQNRMVQQS